jgi:hypothetical protein
MVKKGVSAEEKRRRILEIYTDSKSVFNLKEIEKLGARKGVVEQTIKDVNQGLVDDGKVNTEKIGSGNFYWSFPSQQYVQKNEKLSLLKEKMGKSKHSADGLDEQLEKAKIGRQPTKERTASIELLRSLKAEKARLASTIDMHKENDPEQIEQQRKKIKLCVDSANRWTDNVWAIKEWVVQKKQMMESPMFDKWMGLTQDFDYVE